MNLKTISSLVLVLAGASNAAASRAFVPKTMAADKALSLRGGAGPIPADTMAKTLTGLYGVQGVYNYLAPEKNNEMYGIKGSKMSNFIGEGVGNFVLSSAAAMYAMIYHDMPALKAIGVSTLPGMVQSARALLNDVPADIGIANGGQYFNLAVNIFVAHALLTGADYATNAAKGYAVYMGLAMLQCRLAPASSFKTWGCPEGSNSEKFILKILGQAGLGYSVLVWYLANGTDTLTSIGYFCVPLLVSFLEFVASGEMEAAGVDNAKVLPWIALMTASIATLAL